MQGGNGIDRRQVVAGITGLAGMAGLPTLTASGAAVTSGSVSVPANGRAYARVALRSDTISVAAVQSRIRAVDGQAPGPGIRDNLAHMLEVIDKVQFFGGTKDLLCFHEFPLQGWNPWDRKDLERVCIEVPGPETEAIAARARRYGCYIKFGAYVKDRDWPGHVLSITTVIGPKGDIVARDWKARNIVGVFPGVELVTTTIYNVLDRYIEMYGADAVVPVHRTDIGNLATSSTQLEPELIRVMAIKGAELVLRTASGGFSADDIKMGSVYNKIYSVIVNNAVSPDNPNFLDDANGGAGGSAIYGPRGEVLAEADSKFEQEVVARLPIASYRATHQIPDVHLALYQSAFNEYRPRQSPGLFSRYLPTDLKDAKRYLDEQNNWR
jgi:predicted amidohydrolase